MKRALSIIILATILIMLTPQVYAGENGLLSEMSESECIEFIKQYNVEIPDDYDEVCTAVKTYCGDGTLGDVHTLACGDCGNSMGTATENCTFEYIFTGTIDGHNVHSRICTECGYVKLDKVQCFYKSNNICMLCGQAGNIQAGGILKAEDLVE